MSEAVLSFPVGNPALRPLELVSESLDDGSGLFNTAYVAGQSGKSRQRLLNMTMVSLTERF